MQPTDYSKDLMSVLNWGEGGGVIMLCQKKNSFVKPNEMGKIRKPIEYNDISDIWCPLIGKRKKTGVHVNNTNFKK